MLKVLKPKCYNCNHSGNQFKIAGKTHLHCNNPKEYNQEKWDNEEFNEMDTLRYFWDTCKDHEFKSKENA